MKTCSFEPCGRPAWAKGLCDGHYQQMRDIGSLSELYTRPKGKRSHGQSLKRKLTPEYRCWANLIQRCRNQKNPSYFRYGGRGIQVCDEWAGSFEAFFRDMGKRPSPRHSIERMDNEKGYEPGNCCWATTAAQSRNSRRTKRLSYAGRTMCIADWASAMGVHHDRIYARMRRKLPIEKVLAEWPKREKT